jgi:hypothetical protein
MEAATTPLSKTELKKFSRRMWQALISAGHSGRVEAAYIRAANILVRHGLLELGQRLPDGYYAARLTTAGVETLNSLRK